MIIKGVTQIHLRRVLHCIIKSKQLSGESTLNKFNDVILL